MSMSIFGVLFCLYFHIWNAHFRAHFPNVPSLFVFVRRFRWKIQAAAAVGWKDMERNRQVSVSGQ